MDENKTVWDDVFKDKGRVFTEVHPDVMQLSEDLQPAKSKRILDLGSGTGRHVIHLAKSGFDVHGFDNSPMGIDMTRQWLADEDLSAELLLGDMTEGLPFEDEFFDAVISVQVIHHARLETVEMIIGEIARVLKPEGTVLVTVPTLRNQGTRHKEIAPNTYIPLDGIEKGLPHYLFTDEQLRKSFSQFDIQDLHVDRVSHRSLRGILKS